MEEIHGAGLRNRSGTNHDTDLNSFDVDGHGGSGCVNGESEVNVKESSGSPKESVKKGKSSDKDGGRSSSAFECNICFDLPKDPVVTQCGHLYCWPCIYRWMNVAQSAQNHSLCPVCKAAVEKQTVIPIYGRGNEEDDPRERPVDEIPPRPQGQRTEAVHNHNTNAYGMPTMHFGSPFAGFYPHDGANYGSFSFTAFGLFPSLFGMQFTYPPNGTAGAPVAPGATHNTAPGMSPNDQAARNAGVRATGFRNGSAFQHHHPQQHQPVLTPEQRNQEYLSRLMLMLAMFIIFSLLFF